ncbi:HAMP domain-containing sensor histidine kinase [Nocardioides sp.]|uniref:sensor histidine kinase n=1 Tax=Nocardioides sp. TaxID=35761 RepID=UPI002B26A37B|nr:HAMP domain-containing sensor histidine kinase [Nocardioides sp.]
MTSAQEPNELVALRELHRIVLLVNSETDLSAVLETAAQGVVDVLGFQAVVVNMVTARGDFEAVTVLGPPRESLLGARTPREAFLHDLEVADDWGMLRFIPEGRIEAELYPECTWTTPDEPADVPDAWLRDDALYAPLYNPERELLGILSVDLPHDGRRPSALRREVLEMYAVQMGRAIGHARDRERLAERLRLSTTTRQILQMAAVADDLEPLLEASIEPIQTGYRATAAWIRLFADKGGAWTASSYPNALPGDGQDPSDLYLDLDLDQALGAAEQVAVECWRTQRTSVVSRSRPVERAEGLGLTGRDPALDWLEALGLDQFVLVPIGVSDQCLGYLVLAREIGLDWTEIEEQNASDIGRELGRVIESARIRAREHDLIIRLEELDDYKSRVVTTIIHELKNPLAVVVGNLELARDEPALVARAHTAIQRGAQRMQKLVDDLLALTKLREPVADTLRVPVDLGAVVRDVAALVIDQAQLGAVTLDVSAVPGGVRILGEPAELDRLVLNLVSNAIKYTGPGGRVTVSLTTEADHVVLVCADDGIGIAPADMASVFGEFDRSSNPEARAKPGSGLGLPIVRRIVQRHDGSIEVDSTLGRGSRFVVTLPIGQIS